MELGGIFAHGLTSVGFRQVVYYAVLRAAITGATETVLTGLGMVSVRDSIIEERQSPKAPEIRWDGFRGYAVKIISETSRFSAFLRCSTTVDLSSFNRLASSSEFILLGTS